MITPEKLAESKKNKTSAPKKPVPPALKLMMKPLWCCLNCLLAQISLRNCLVIVFVGLVLVTSVPLWLISMLNTQIVVSDLSTGLCNSYMSDIMNSMNSYFGTLQTPSKIAASTLQQHIVDGGSMDDAIRLRDLFRDKIIAYSECKYFLVGLENGYLEGWGRNVLQNDVIYWFHSDHLTKSYCTPNCTNPAWQNMALDYYSLNNTFLYRELIQRDYDARKRGWYKKPIELNKFVLTDLYVFVGEKTVGLTAVEPIYHPTNQSRLLGVTSIDIDMRTLSSTLSKLKVAKTGWVVLVDSSFSMVATSFPLSQTVAEEDTDRLIDGEESIEPRVRFAVRALKDYGNRSFKTLQEKYAKGQNQFTSWYGLGNHRILFNTAEYFSIGLIPIIVVPENDFSLGIIIGYIVTILFLLLVLGSSIIFACVFSVVIAIPLVKISKLMQRAKNMKLAELKPVWYVGILHEIRKMQNAFFVMAERLKEYRAFLPQEILHELDKKNKNAIDFKEEKAAKSFRTSSMNDKERKNSVQQQDSKNRSASLATSNSDHKSDKSGHKKQKLDALAIGLEFLEGYTMVTMTWDNYYECADILGMDDFIQAHSHYLRIVQDVSKRCHAILDVTTKGFALHFPSASQKALSLAINATDEIRDKLKFNGFNSEIVVPKISFAVCAESMMVGTIGTKDCRVKSHFGACEKLNRQCKRMARKLAVSCVCCDNIFNSLKQTCDFRPCGLTVINGLVHTMYVFDGKNTQQEDVEWMYKMAGEEKEKVKNNFAVGFDSLLRGDYEQAKENFSQYLEVVDPKDNLARIMLEKTNSFVERELDAESVRKELTLE